jgi:hypothetical protein
VASPNLPPVATGPYTAADPAGIRAISCRLGTQLLEQNILIILNLLQLSGCEGYRYRLGIQLVNNNRRRYSRLLILTEGTIRKEHEKKKKNRDGKHN